MPFAKFGRVVSLVGLMTFSCLGASSGCAGSLENRISGAKQVQKREKNLAISNPAEYQRQLRVGIALANKYETFARALDVPYQDLVDAHTARLDAAENIKEFGEEFDYSFAKHCSELKRLDQREFMKMFVGIREEWKSVGEQFPLVVKEQHVQSAYLKAQVAVNNFIQKIHKYRCPK